MVVNEELVNKVKAIFGLNTYEARIWVALLMKGVATAGELADLADIPRSRAYDVLESLEKKGFVVMKLGKPIKYMAIPPSEVVERVKKRYEETIQRKMKEMESLKSSELLQELEKLQKSGSANIDLSEKSGAFKGQQNIISHLETMLKEADKNVYMLLTESFFAKMAMVLKPIFYELKSRGVSVKVIAPINEVTAKYVEDIMEYAEIYDSGELRGRIITIDEEEVMIMIFDEKEVPSAIDVGIWVYAPALAKSLNQLLEISIQKLKPASQALKELGL